MKFLTGVFLAAFIAGCSEVPQATRDRAAEAADDLHRHEADFRPSDHDPERAPVSSAGVTNGLRPDSAAADDSSAAADDEEIQGFRVQIFSTTNIDAAKARRAEAESYFPGTWFYMQYDPPAYKIRAGNFRQRFEADRFARLAADQGFTDAWTVPARVFKHPPPPSR